MLLRKMYSDLLFQYLPAEDEERGVASLPVYGNLVSMSTIFPLPSASVKLATLDVGELLQLPLD
jgi:hypothetical protein